MVHAGGRKSSRIFACAADVMAGHTQAREEIAHRHSFGGDRANPERTTLLLRAAVSGSEMAAREISRLERWWLEKDEKEGKKMSARERRDRRWSVRRRRVLVSRVRAGRDRRAESSHD